MRLAIILAALGAGAVGFTQWLVRLALPGVELRGEIRGRFRDGLGWWSPAMAPHWADLRAEGWRRAFHNLKNLLVEWVTSDPQRAGKALAFWGAVGWWIAAALGAWLVLAPRTAFAGESKAVRCVPRAVLTEYLGRAYGEYRQAGGEQLQIAGQWIELYVAAGGRTWSLIVVDAVNGFACLSTYGRNWQLAPQGDPT